MNETASCHPVTRRWAMAVAISIYLGDTSKFDAFKAA